MIRFSQGTFVFVALLLASAETVVAQSLPVLPYEGQLDQNGTPITGTRTFEFMLTESPLGPTDVGCWEDSEPTFVGGCYASGPVDLELVGGAFAVDLGVGATAAFSTEQEAWVFGNRVIYLSIAVGDSVATLAPLAGTQQLVNRQRVGYAVSNGSAPGFTVTGDLAVSGGASFGGLIEGEASANVLGVVTAVRAGDQSLPVGTSQGDLVAEDDVIIADDLFVGSSTGTVNLNVSGTMELGDDGTFIRSMSTCTADAIGESCSFRHPRGLSRNRMICILTRFGTEGDVSNDECDIDAGRADEWVLFSEGGANCEARCYYW